MSQGICLSKPKRRGSCKDPKNYKSNSARKWHLELLHRFVDSIKIPQTTNYKTETVNEFLQRGGRIEKCVYKEPPVWKKTFNGFSKYGKR